MTIEVDGEPVACFRGETVATAILTWRDHLAEDGHRPRSVFCAIGSCFECVAEIEGISGVRTCMTSVAPGMRVRTSPGGSRA
jgi:D-hydroxyproline dehydrogenase subunit gamma